MRVTMWLYTGQKPYEVPKPCLPLAHLPETCLCKAAIRFILPEPGCVLLIVQLLYCHRILSQKPRLH